MRIIRFARAAGLALLIMIVLCTCNLPSSRRGQAPAGFGDWNIQDSTVYIHSFTKEGLLDSSLEIYYHLRYGQPHLLLKGLTTRVYDGKGHLVEERSFDYREKSKKWELTSRRKMTYDQKGNLITDVTIDIEKSKSTLFHFAKMVYNQHNQEILRLDEIPRMEDNPYFMNADSVLAHMVKIPRYDTTVISSIYDSNGNLVTITSGGPRASGESVSYITYMRGVKTASYIVDNTGDTIVIYRYDKDRGLTRQIRTDVKAVPPVYADTCWYRGDKQVKSVHYSFHPRSKLMIVCQYDAKGNRIRQMSYH